MILDRLEQVLAKLDHGPAYPRNPSLARSSSADAVPHDYAAPAEELNDEQGMFDQLRIPTSQTTPDAILSWPIFDHRWPASFNTDPVFEAELSDGANAQPSTRTNVSFQACGINEEMIPNLVQNFLHYVHIKNPVVDADSIVWSARTVSEEGIKWDATSCLVVSCLRLLF